MLNVSIYLSNRPTVDGTTGEIRVLTPGGQLADLLAQPIPVNVNVNAGVVPQSATGIKWGGGIQDQGLPFEDYLATKLPADTRLPPNFKTFDFYDRETRVATSAKTLDTMTVAKMADPSQVYSSLKGNVDSIVNFSGIVGRPGAEVDAARISARELHVAVPAGTNSAQWGQIHRAIEYGRASGVTVKITVVKP